MSDDRVNKTIPLLYVVNAAAACGHTFFMFKKNFMF